MLTTIEADNTTGIEFENPVPEDRPVVTKKNWRSRILHEPFFHFMVLGLLIFFLGQVTKKYRNTAQNEIRITNKDVYRLASLWEKQYGSIPSTEQIHGLVDNYVREEVLYREGMDAGLHQDDEVIRRRIVQKEEFLVQDMAVISEPSEEDLYKYFKEHISAYALPSKLSFSHIYFSPDFGGEEAARNRARKVLAGLSGKNISRSPEAGDRFAYLYDYSNQNKDDIFQLFGGSPFTDSIFSYPEKEWTGPVHSGYGWHLVFVNEKSAATYPEFSQVKDKVKNDYLQYARDKKNAEAYAQLEGKYNIIREYNLEGNAKK